jgi:hypothetical protein
VGNWKSNKNIEQFINNSYEPLAKDFLDKGDGFYIDGYSPLPSFRAHYSIKDGQNYSYYDLSLHCRTMEFENYSELIDFFEKLGEDNYIFLFSIKPFQIRFSTVSSEYDIIGCDRRVRLREQKIKSILNG